MKKVLIIALILITGVGIYGFLINPSGYIMNEENIYITDLEDSFDNFKIVQLSDTLITSSKDIKKLENITNDINELEPDIIVFTGDLISNSYTPSDEEIETIAEYLNNLECTLYKYAVMGDNDEEQIEIFQSIMNSANFTILDNESIYLFYEGNMPIKITGITNLDNLLKALTIEDDLDTTLNLVLTHYPDYLDTLAEQDIDVILAGHSLKGQIRIPFYGGLIKKDKATNYLNDYYELNNTVMYVSGGIGTENIKFRLFNKPEINLYILKKNTL